MRRWLPVGLVALAFVVTELQWARTIGWDEVEYFRATRWVAEGRVPFRDFWEHHLPLQWYLFAPVAALAGDGAGVAPLLAMRWAQLPVWIAVLWFLFAIARRAGLDEERALAGVLLVTASVLFVESAVEYRLDAPAAAFYFGALWLVLARPHARGSWIGFGLLMSAAVLANMRLVPLVVATAALLLFFRPEKWQWNRVALWMIPGVAIAALAFGAWVLATGTFDTLVETMRHNAEFVRYAADVETGVLRLPFTRPDPGALVLLIGGAIGVARAFGLLPGGRPEAYTTRAFLALLAVLSLVFVAMQGVQYVYHFQIPLLLLSVLAAAVLKPRWSMALIAVAIGFHFVRMIPIGPSMAYKDAVMREADRRTLPHEQVFDGVGYALRREPAYRYWFLPLVVRMLAERGAIEPYDAPQMMAAPPAAIVHSYRVNQWLRTFPRAGAYATHHYVPLYRDLWIPGLTAAGTEALWIAPRGGRYRLYASELLLEHPWFRAPLSYALYDGEDAPLFEVRLHELPQAEARVEASVDGRVVGETFALRQGAVVRVRAGRAVGVVIVPEDVETLFSCPPSPGVM